MQGHEGLIGEGESGLYEFDSERGLGDTLGGLYESLRSATRRAFMFE